MPNRNQIRRRPSNRVRHIAFAIAATACAWISVSPAWSDDGPTKVSSRPVPAVGNAAAPVAGGQLAPYIRIASRSRDAIAAVHDYEAVFTKAELVGRTMYADQMAMKFRSDPFSVYLKFIGRNNNQGREVLYFDGRYGNKLVAHEPPGTLRGFVGTIYLDPTASQAMAEGRHPITRIGMYNMIDGLIHQWEAEAQIGDPNDPQPAYYPDAKLGNIPCKVCETTHLQATQPYKFYRSRLYIEKSTNYPIRLEEWGAPDRAHAEPYIIEQYTYTDIRPNVGLTDSDFDVRNRNYRF
jgi:Protein of unknown function (DUF1571)